MPPEYIIGSNAYDGFIKLIDDDSASTYELEYWERKANGEGPYITIQSLSIHYDDMGDLVKKICLLSGWSDPTED